MTTTTGLVWTTATGRRMTLAELAAFLGEARDAGVPGDAAPNVGLGWRGGVKRIAVARPLAKGAPGGHRRPGG